MNSHILASHTKAQTRLTEQEIMDALRRSGYLFESSISKLLSDQDYFVETNVKILDPDTGKDREIDIVTYQNELNIDYEKKVKSQAIHVFELKNNIHPVVLITRYQFNPNSPTELIREYISVPDDIKYDGWNIYNENLVYKLGHTFSQFCSFHKKKGAKEEFMAFHPDELYVPSSTVMKALSLGLAKMKMSHGFAIGGDITSICL